MLQRCIVVGALAVGSVAFATPPTSEPRGERSGPTADQQSNTKSDVELAAKIRRAVVGDRTLSMAAHNVQIITQGGVVTLKGPVQTLVEKSSVASKAVQLAGASNVRDELTVAP